MSAGRKNAKASGQPKALKKGEELRFLDFAGLKAARADAETPVRSLYNRAHRAQIHVPAALSHVVGVTDVVSKLRPFAAHFAYACHRRNSKIGGLDQIACFRPKVSGFLQEACSARAE